MFGFMGKILRVNLSTQAISEESVDEQEARKFLGGAGLATKYLFDEVAKGIDPLGSDNKLIFMSGPLTGTISPSSGRFSAVTKSPLTGFWAASNSGGRWGLDLKKSGYDGIIIEGKSDKPVYLAIEDDKVEIRDAASLWGMGVQDTIRLIGEETPKTLNVACIGVAGEKLVRYAAIMNDLHRTLGRCGFGAVMGSKQLKAIAIGGTHKIKLANEPAFKKAATTAKELIKESLLKMTLEEYGTNMVLELVNVKGGLPTRNWQFGSCDYAEDIGGPAVSEKILVGKKACFSCPIACGRKSEIKTKKYASKGEGPEYESVGALGPMCDVKDLDAITYAHFLCNEYGLDTVSTGSTIAFAMEWFEKNILTKKELDGIELKFGDADLMIEFIHKIGKREGIGDLLAEGTKIVSEKLSQGSQHFAMQVKGLELPAYDCRATKMTGLAYATANRGGDHITAYIQGPTFLDIPYLIVDESTIEDPTVGNPAEVQVVKDMEDALTVFDAVGCCKFMGMALFAEDLTPIIANATGWDFDVTEFRKGGERIFNLARMFNIREEATRQDDTLPGRLLKEPLPDGPAKGSVVDLDPLLDAYYEARDWDIATGHPAKQKLEELGLSNFIELKGGK